MPHRLIFAGLVLLSAMGCAHAQSPELKLPAWSELRGHATESVDISLGSLPLMLAGWLMDDHDPDSADMKRALQGLHSLHVRHYEFGPDFVYPKADIDALRNQLGGAGWNHIAQVRDRRKDQDVDVYLAYQNQRITGLAIVASEPSGLTIINAIGSLDLAQANTLRKHFEPHGEDDSNDHEPAPTHP